MAEADCKFHLTALIEQSAVYSAGISIYDRQSQPKATFLTYRQLFSVASNKAQSLRKLNGITPGKIVLIHFEDFLDTIVWFWAAVISGCVPTISTPLVNNSEGRKAHFQHLHSLLLDPIVITRSRSIATDFAENEVLQLASVEKIETQICDASYSCTRQTLKRPLEAIPYEDVNFVPSKRCRHDSADDLDNPEPIPSPGSSHSDYREEDTRDPAILMLTSGSTGNSKAVCLTHGQIQAAITGKLAAMPLPQNTTLLNWIALDHVASLVEIHLCAMFAGLDQVHVPSAVLIGEPLLFLRLLSEHRVSRTFAPNFFLSQLQRASSMFTKEDVSSINLKHLFYIASGGEPNEVGVCVQLTKYLKQLGVSRSNVITPGFGMTETCAGAIFNLDCPSIDLRNVRKFTSVGRCILGIEMRIAAISDSDHQVSGKASGTPQTGALEIRGPVVFGRYFNNEKATREAFTADGWFRTGDMASIDNTGNLVLVGRSKDLINVNGVKYLPQDIEKAIEQSNTSGITPKFVVSFGHQPSNSVTEYIFVIYQHEYQADDIKARSTALQSIVRVVMLLTGVRPKVLPLPVGVLQKSSLGKLSRAKTATSLLQGEYQIYEEKDASLLRETQVISPRNSTEKTILNILLQLLNIESVLIGIDTPIFDTGITSVDLIRLKTAVEKAFGIMDISIASILTHTTIRELATFVHDTQASQPKTRYDPVITLQSRGSQTPLWLIHPGIGEVLVFIGLVQYFPDRPLYALRTRGFNAGEQPFNDLSEIVITYHQAIKLKQAKGPYAIAGYSYGSMLAFEISKIFEAEGDSVAFLGCFNLPPHIKERMRLLDWTSGLLHIACFCGIISELCSERLMSELQNLPSKAEKVGRLLQESDESRCEELALTHASLLNWTDVAWSLQKIGWEYDPSGIVSRIDVFYCQPLKIVAKTRQEYREKKLTHWANFANDLRFHEVDGEHYSMIGPDHIDTFQHTLRQAIAAREAL